MPKKHVQHTAVGAALGAGFVVAAAAAAGAYFIYGKDAAKRRATVKGWALKAKGEVLEQLEKIGDVDEKTYQAVIDKVSAKYSALKHVDAADVAKLSKELRGHWRSMMKQYGPAKRAKRSPKKTTTKRAKRPATRS